MDEAIAVLKRAGRGHRRSRRHPERRRRGPEEQLPAVGHLLGCRQGQGQGRGLLGRVQVRHEARLQQVARVARRRGAGKTLTELRDWNTAHQKRRRDQVRPVATSTSPTRWTSRSDRARYEADRAKDIRLDGDARHRRGHEGGAPRRAAVSRRERRGDRREARLSDGDRAVRAGAESRRRRRSRPASTPSRSRSASASPAWPAANRG